jgi:hypothetical protein
MELDVLSAIKQLQQSVQALSLGKEKGGKGVKCFECEGFGHYARDCPNRKTKGGRGGKEGKGGRGGKDHPNE